MQVSHDAIFEALAPLVLGKVGHYAIFLQYPKHIAVLQKHQGKGAICITLHNNWLICVAIGIAA